jgi:hypothetical protein
MTDKVLQTYMNGMLVACKEKNPNFREIIAGAVQLGMQYQEEKIKSGIDIVFNELHKKNNYESSKV